MNKDTFRLPKIILFFTSIFIILFSCEKKKTITQKKNIIFPDRTLINANIITTDSGKITLNIHSPLIEEYISVDSPYTVFRKGLKLDFYEKKSTKPGYFQANWAKLNDATGIYEGRGNVIIVNEKNDSLKCEQIFWNKNKKIVYTSKKVYLISNNGDSLKATNGLEGTDNLENYTLFNNQGHMYVDDKNQNL